jgi:hypothetical protein
VLAASGNTAKNGRNLETVEEKAPNCVDQRVAFPWLSLGLDEVAGRGSTSGLRSYLTAEVDLGKPLKVLRERFDAIELGCAFTVVGNIGQGNLLVLANLT